MIFSFTDVEHTRIVTVSSNNPDRTCVLCATVETQFGSNMYVEEMQLMIAGYGPVVTEWSSMMHCKSGLRRPRLPQSHRLGLNEVGTVVQHDRDDLSFAC